MNNYKKNQSNLYSPIGYDENLDFQADLVNLQEKLDQAIDNLNEKLADNDASVESVKTQIVTLRNDIQSLNTTLSNDIMVINEKHNMLTTKLQVMIDMFNELRDRHDALETKFESKLNDLNSKWENQVVTNFELGATMTNNSLLIEDLSKKVTSNSGALSALKYQLNSHVEDIVMLKRYLSYDNESSVSMINRRICLMSFVVSSEQTGPIQANTDLWHVYLPPSVKAVESIDYIFDVRVSHRIYNNKSKEWDVTDATNKFAVSIYRNRIYLAPIENIPDNYGHYNFRVVAHRKMN